MSKVILNLDNGDEYIGTIAKGQTTDITFEPTLEVLDLVNAKLYLSDSTRCKLLKEYSIGNGLSLVDTNSIRWIAPYEDLQALHEVVFDAFFINTEDKRRTFKGKIRVNNSQKYTL